MSWGISDKNPAHSLVLYPSAFAFRERQPVLFAGILHFPSSLPLWGLQKSSKRSLGLQNCMKPTPHGGTEKNHSAIVVPSWLPTHGKAPRTPNLLKQMKIKEDLPSSSSRLAPPPVLTWLTLSSVFHLAQQVAVSPPPVAQAESMRHTRNSDFIQLKAHAEGQRRMWGK